MREIILASVGLFVMTLSCKAQHFNQHSYSQEIAERVRVWPTEVIRQLRVGDTLPDIRLKGVDHWSGLEFRVRPSSRNKLTIIDFWGIYCSACIAAFPEMEALQKQFRDSLQVLLVTRDTRPAVEFCKSISDNVKRTELPMYNDDKELYKYLVYMGLPKYVWIDSSGRILAFGNGITNERTVTAYFQNHTVPNSDDSPHIFDFDMSKPAFVEGGGRLFSLTEYYSVIMRSIGGFMNNGRVDYTEDSITHSVSKIWLDNYPIILMFKHLIAGEKKARYGRAMSWMWDNQMRVEYDVKDSSVFERAGFNLSDPRKNFSYCYELSVPLDDTGKIWSYMRTDLERYFHLTAHVDMRRRDCWVIGRDSLTHSSNLVGYADGGAIHTMSIQGQTIFHDKSANIWRVSESPVEEFLEFLMTSQEFSDHEDNIPIIWDPAAEPGRPINMTIRGKVGDNEPNLKGTSLEMFKVDLESAGYYIKREKIAIPVLVLTDDF